MQKDCRQNTPQKLFTKYNHGKNYVQAYKHKHIHRHIHRHIQAYAHIHCIHTYIFIWKINIIFYSYYASSFICKRANWEALIAIEVSSQLKIGLTHTWDKSIKRQRDILGDILSRNSSHDRDIILFRILYQTNNTMIQNPLRLISHFSWCNVRPVEVFCGEDPGGQTLCLDDGQVEERRGGTDTNKKTYRFSVSTKETHNT